jgi:hypothetical protein
MTPNLVIFTAIPKDPKRMDWRYFKNDRYDCVSW